MKNKFILILLILFSITVYSQDKPFSKLKYDKVIIYDFNGGKGEESAIIIDKYGKLSKSVRKQAILDTNTIKLLSSKLENKNSYGGGTASCFDPHLGIVYYFKNKPVAHISVCLDCNRLQSSIEINAQKQGKTGKGKDTYYLLDGMSNSFRNYLNSLVLKYKFSHPIIS